MKITPEEFWNTIDRIYHSVLNDFYRVYRHKVLSVPQLSDDGGNMISLFNFMSMGLTSYMIKMKYLIDFLDDVVACMLYEHYFVGDKVIESLLRKEVSNEMLASIKEDNFDNMLNDTNFYTVVGGIIESFESNKKLCELLFMIKLNPIVKEIYSNVDR